MIKKRQFNGVPFEGVLHQTEQRVDLSATRGIIINRPERWVVNTPVGQIDIGQGDWVIEFPGNRLYVIKNQDISALDDMQKPARWRLW